MISHLTYVGDTDAERHQLRLRHGDGELRRHGQVPHHHRDGAFNRCNTNLVER
jgi:hypothetical protein